MTTTCNIYIEIWSGWWFQPIWKILVKMESWPSRGENKKYLKPPSSDVWYVYVYVLLWHPACLGSSRNGIPLFSTSNGEKAAVYPETKWWHTSYMEPEQSGSFDLIVSTISMTVSGEKVELVQNEDNNVTQTTAYLPLSHNVSQFSIENHSYSMFLVQYLHKRCQLLPRVIETRLRMRIQPCKINSMPWIHCSLPQPVS